MSVQTQESLMSIVDSIAVSVNEALYKLNVAVTNIEGPSPSEGCTAGKDLGQPALRERLCRLRANADQLLGLSIRVAGGIGDRDYNVPKCEPAFQTADKWSR